MSEHLIQRIGPTGHWLSLRRYNWTWLSLLLPGSLFMLTGCNPLIGQPPPTAALLSQETPTIATTATLTPSLSLSPTLTVPTFPAATLVATATRSVTATADTTVSLPLVSNAPTATAVPSALPAPPSTPTAANFARVIGDGLNVRLGPATTYPVLQVIGRASPLTVIGQNITGDWLYVLSVNNILGWVARDFTDYVGVAPILPTPTLPPSPLPATSTATPTALPVISEWRGEYFDNRSLIGAPRLVRNDYAVQFDWGYGAPAPELSADEFSARWTRTLSFAEGLYRFSAQSDDGVRVWLDGELLLDRWYETTAQTVSLQRLVSGGAHVVRIEYFEARQLAQIRVWWEQVATPTSFADWKGEYWANRDLSGEPSLVRNDVEIDFDWAAGGPAAGLPSDDFSVRWSRRVTFDAGLYRFSARADDGFRFLIDGNRVLDEWHANNGENVYTLDLPLDGRHRLTVEYYERAGEALVEFWWQRLRETLTPTWTPLALPATATPTATPSATLSPTPSGTPTPTPIPTSTVTPTPTPLVTLSPTPQPYATVNPGTGRAGETVTVSGGGFPASSTVNVYLARLVSASASGANPLPYASTQSDANGNYAVTFVIPATWPDGEPIASEQLVILVATLDFASQASAIFTYLLPTPTASATILPSATPSPTPTLTEAATVEPTATATLTPTLLPTETPTAPAEPTATATLTPLPTETPTSTETPSPVPTETATEPAPPPTATPTAPLLPYAAVTPATGNGGTQVLISGGGFPANVAVEVYLGVFSGSASDTGDLERYAATTTDSAGAYQVSLTLPDNWPNGAPVQPGKLLIMVATADFSTQATALFDYSARGPNGGPGNEPVPQ